MLSGGGTSQTAVNACAGARSQVAGLVTALLVAVALTLLASLFFNLPQATFGAIVLVAAVGLVRAAEFRGIASFNPRPLEMARAAMGGRTGGRYFPQLRDAVEAFTTRTG